jgi:hypothetical protein
MAKAFASTTVAAPRFRSIAWNATPTEQRGEKAGLGRLRHRLYLGVAEPAIGISGLVGLAHGKKGAAFAPEGRSALRGYDFSTDRE